MLRKNPCVQLATIFKNKLTQISESIYSAFGFIKTNKPWVLQATACVAVVAYEAYNTYENLVEQGSDFQYAIARSCGASLKLLTLSTFFPLSRVLYTRIQNSRVGSYFGLDQRIVDHKIFATGILLFASTHTIAHYFYNPANFGKQPGITGIIMLSSFALPISGIFLLKKYAKPCTVKSYGSTIMRTHQSGAACFLLAYLFHTADLRLLKYAAISWSPLVIDRIIEKLFYRHPSFIKKAVIIPNTDFISLHINKPKHFREYHPGQFALLSFSEIDNVLEKPHPFTIVNVNANEIEFLIKQIGPWTQKLYHWIGSLDEQNHSSYSVTMTGPLGKNILCDYSYKNPIAFIGTGIGMTPALAALNEMTKRNVKAQLEFHISQKSLAEFIPCINVLSKIPPENSYSLKSVNFYITSKHINKDDIEQKFRNLESKSNLHFDFSKMNIGLNKTGMFSKSVNVNVHFSRPDLENIIKGVKTVNICGNPEVSKTVVDLARKLGKRCYSESF